MNALVIVEHNNKILASTTRSTIKAALELSSIVDLLVLGFKVEDVIEEASQIAGVSKVYWKEDPSFEHPLAENIAELVAKLAPSYNAILTTATTFGKNLLPRVAALLDVAQLSDVSRILDSETFEHPIYAGNVIETVKLLDKIKILTIRSTAFSPVTETQIACTKEELMLDSSSINTLFINHELSKSERPDLASAKIIVSGGRGMQSKEKFKLIEELADSLGAAIGASRAAVDAGFVPNDYQVGQTGKIVAPEVYFAIGISGAIQHLAGMKDSKIIVAINKDPDAPIFQIADYGIVGDLFDLVPQLIERLRGRK